MAHADGKATHEELALLEQIAMTMGGSLRVFTRSRVKTVGDTVAPLRT